MHSILDFLCFGSICIALWDVTHLQHWSSVVEPAEPRKQLLQCRGHTISQNQLRSDMYYRLNT